MDDHATYLNVPQLSAHNCSIIMMMGEHHWCKRGLSNLAKNPTSKVSDSEIQVQWPYSWILEFRTVIAPSPKSQKNIEKNKTTKKVLKKKKMRTSNNNVSKLIWHEGKRQEVKKIEKEGAGGRSQRTTGWQCTVVSQTDVSPLIGSRVA